MEQATRLRSEVFSDGRDILLDLESHRGALGDPWREFNEESSPGQEARRVNLSLAIVEPIAAPWR